MRDSEKPTNPNSFFFLFFQLALLLHTSPVPSQAWDGVVITQADYQGLQAFKRGLVDPFNYLTSWNGTGLDACSGAWTGIKCVQGNVIAIQLPWKGLGGHISVKVGQLTALRKLSLHDNSIGGQIPSALGFLRDLRGVYLFNNRFSGSIPASIGNCVVLQTLDFSNNLLNGPIPSSFSNNTRLYRLNLSYNNLSGEVPIGLTSLPSLVFLFLNNNNLSGSIPDTWGNNATNANKLYQLGTLYLDHNSLSGIVPASISKLSLLEQLSLNNNQLNGTIPQEIGNLSRLQTLDLSRNSINGEIPTTIGDISSLFQLDLSENNLTGEIPSSIDNLANLTALNVSYNNLSGPVSPILSQKFNSSSFTGNLQLCGYSSSVPCFLAPPPNITPPFTPTESKTRKLNTKELILTIVGISLLFLLLLFCVLLSCLCKKGSTGTGTEKKGTTIKAASGKGGKASTTSGSEVTSTGDTGGKLVHFDGPLAFTADDLLCATAEIMGKSTYGTVYKATLEDGSQVAVKRLREKVTKNQKEFETEVNAIGKIRHENLLALRAYYVGPKGEKLLVFDYMPKGSLAAFLHARGPDSPIDWPTRLRIAIGVARGLVHLHTQSNMVHGNLTSANILLEDQSNVRISDYGLSRLMSTAANSNVIATAGALGYRAPELSKLKKANSKTDVYSLGVVILELLTGKSPSDTTNGLDLPQWVASVVEEEWTNEVFDVELMKDAAAGSSTGDELVSMLKLALHCVDPSPAARPEIQKILKQLEEIKPELMASGEGPSSVGEAGSDDGETQPK